MANSLMELYGGGMTGPSNNYQLGGQIASSRRGREYQGEIRKLEEKQRAAAKRKRKSGFWGSVGSIAGGALGSLLGPAGTAIGAGLGRAAGESGYAREDYSGGKYAQETRGDLREAEDDFREGIRERALVSGIQAAIMPGVYEKAGKAVSGAGQFVKGIPTALEAGQEMGLTGMQALGDYAKSFSPSSALAGASYNPLATVASGASMSTPDLGLASNLDYSMAREAYNEMNPDGDVSYLDYLEGFDLPGQGFFAGGGLVNYMVPQMQYGGLVDQQLPNVPMGRPQPPNMPMGPPKTNVPMGSGLPDLYADSPMADVVQKGSIRGDDTREPSGPTTGGVQDLTPDLSDTDFSALEGFQVFGDDNPVFGADTDWSGLYEGVLNKGMQGTTTSPTGTPGFGDYGTAIGSQSALTQMGMGDIANDPRLQKYLGDLPQFSQGYRQQFGDIQKGGRQSLAQMYAAQRSAGGGFASPVGGSAQQFQQQYAGLMGEQGRQRRGVVEGFQSDLLSGIRDIEQKGEFEFGSPAGTDPMVAYMQNNPGLTREEAEAQYEQEQSDYYGQQYG